MKKILLVLLILSGSLSLNQVHAMSGWVIAGGGLIFYEFLKTFTQASFDQECQDFRGSFEYDFQKRLEEGPASTIARLESRWNNWKEDRNLGPAHLFRLKIRAMCIALGGTATVWAINEGVSRYVVSTPYENFNTIVRGIEQELPILHLFSADDSIEVIRVFVNKCYGQDNTAVLVRVNEFLKEVENEIESFVRIDKNDIMDNKDRSASALESRAAILVKKLLKLQICLQNNAHDYIGDQV